MDLPDLVWLPTIVLLAYTIPACYYDLRHREVPEGFWNVMMAFCIPITAALYATGYYPYYLGILSLVTIAIYFILMRVEIYQGADFVYLLWITMFLVQNPVTGHILMPVSYGIFLIASVVGFGILYQTEIVRRLTSTTGLPGFPMMLPISLALWLTVMIA